MAAFRTLVGGEVREYTKLLAESREQAIDRMLDQAKSLGADAVISMRFSTTPQYARRLFFSAVKTYRRRLVGALLASASLLVVGCAPRRARGRSHQLSKRWRIRAWKSGRDGRKGSGDQGSISMTRGHPSHRYRTVPPSPVSISSKSACSTPRSS